MNIHQQVPDTALAVVMFVPLPLVMGMCYAHIAAWVVRPDLRNDHRVQRRVLTGISLVLALGPLAFVAGPWTLAGVDLTFPMLIEGARELWAINEPRFHLIVWILGISTIWLVISLPVALVRSVRPPIHPLARHIAEHYALRTQASVRP